MTLSPKTIVDSRSIIGVFVKSTSLTVEKSTFSISIRFAYDCALNTGLNTIGETKIQITVAVAKRFER